MNIIEYAQTKYATFEEEPLNRVDALILSRLSHAKIERLSGTNLKEAGEVRDFYLFENYGEMFCDGLDDKGNADLWTAASGSRRFRNLKIKNIVSEFNKDEGLQFAAFAFEIDDTIDYVAFRGTDGSMTGWREDFVMAVELEVPAQKRAVEYMNEFYGSGGDDSISASKKKIVLGGHSKGGNLAIYGGLMANEQVLSQIECIYAFDSPGFQDEVLQELTKIQDEKGIKILKFVPQSSIVGILLNSTDDYEIIESTAPSLKQHSPGSWVIEGDDFKHRDEMTPIGKFVDKTTSDWLENATKEEKAALVDTVFDVLEKSGIETVAELRDMDFNSFRMVFDTYTTIDPELRESVQGVLTRFAGQAISNIASGTKERILGEDGIGAIKERLVSEEKITERKKKTRKIRKTKKVKEAKKTKKENKTKNKKNKNGSDLSDNG